MAVKSESAKELYSEFFDRVRDAINTAVSHGDSVASIAGRLGINRSVVNSIRNGSYSSVLNSEVLIAFDIEFDLGIFNSR